MAHDGIDEKFIAENLAVIIPVGPGDETWISATSPLWSSLAYLPDNTEIVFSATGPSPTDASEFAAQTCRFRCRWISGDAGRARQLNRGAKETHAPFLWFVHADTSFESKAIVCLSQALQAEPQSLHFFRLEFRKDGPAQVRLNALGANFRSRYLGMPFGDQAFAVSHELFDRVGGFPENVPYGEDHVFAWRVRHLGRPLRMLPEAVATSARKYAAGRWSRTTLQHLVLTARQAGPEWLQLLRVRCRVRCKGRP